MSDSESDDNFLSADEGEEEASSFSEPVPGKANGSEFELEANGCQPNTSPVEDDVKENKDILEVTNVGSVSDTPLNTDGNSKEKDAQKSEDVSLKVVSNKTNSSKASAPLELDNAVINNSNIVEQNETEVKKEVTSYINQGDTDDNSTREILTSDDKVPEVNQLAQESENIGKKDSNLEDTNTKNNDSSYRQLEFDKTSDNLTKSELAGDPLSEEAKQLGFQELDGKDVTSVEEDAVNDPVTEEEKQNDEEVDQADTCESKMTESKDSDEFDKSVVDKNESQAKASEEVEKSDNKSKSPDTSNMELDKSEIEETDSNLIVDDITSKERNVLNIKKNENLEQEKNGKGNIMSKSNESEPAKDDWGWDSWADDFILQTANKVSNLLETVEGHLGIPDPMEVAQTIKKSELQDQEASEKSEPKENVENVNATNTKQNTDASSSWFSSFVPVTALTNLVQSTGSELVSGGIDALEFIGKKTVDMLSEGDPGLRGKREGVMGNKITLTSVLQEAKLKNEKQDRSSAAVKGDDPAKFQDMFEKFLGVAHLDALEMLSSECDDKLERILNVQSDDAKDESTEVLSDIKKHFDLEEDEEKEDNKVDFKKEIYLVSKKLKLKVTCSKLLNAWSKLKERSENFETENVHECFESAVSSLAEFTSKCIEYYRKVADMLMMTDMDAKKLAVERASALRKITELYENEVSVMANSYGKYLAKNKTASHIVTDVYLEGSNCTSLLHDSHALLLPILQLSAVK